MPELALPPSSEREGTERERAVSAPPEQLAALAYIGQELAAAPNLADGFQRAMRLLDQRLGARRSALFVVDPKERALSVIAAYGMPKEATRARYGVGVVGRVAEGARPIVVPTVRHEPMALLELSEPSAWRETRFSLVAVPLMVAAECAGVFSVYFDGTAPDFPTRLNVLNVVASLVAQSIRPARAPARTEPSRPTQSGVFEYANMIGSSSIMRQVYEQIGQVARTTATVLILGESGTGKELVAQAIHANSERVRQPFIKINGAAFPEQLFESELFGHERGAFTGALARKKGRFELAQHGTLFLDEIGELPLSTQVKLLRVLQSREYERVGGTETLKSDVRLIAATNKSMMEAVASGVFREDLYYRLNVFTITLPPLRERQGDVAPLGEYFLSKYTNLHGKPARSISTAAMDALVRHPWPGNVRELENAIERAVVVCAGPVIEETHLPEVVRGDGGVRPTRKLSLSEAVERLEQELIEEALHDSAGNLARASRALGTTERILRYKVQKYGLSHLRTRQ
ncbi:MAG TPA: sigma 54-interacting transcriptional regulator [Polyangiaceae bacterium]|jgi:Nif-specific regulatory protein|nr:sigma 54-interacting transcriptional regulator [Polyangiaceae bacterium]